MDEARKDPEPVIIQDLWFSQLPWSSKKKKKELEKLEAPVDLTPQSRSYSSWRGEATPCFIRKNVVGHTAFLLPSRNLPNIDRL